MHLTSMTPSKFLVARSVLQALAVLNPQGHIVGLNGNWAVVVQSVPQWHRIFSVIGPMEMSKDSFLNQLKTYIPADDYIMVGNIKGIIRVGVADEGLGLFCGYCPRRDNGTCFA
jgi:hypothetical protein